jgi:hypothetical protein
MRVGLSLPKGTTVGCYFGVDMVHRHFAEALALRVLLQGFEGVLTAMVIPSSTIPQFDEPPALLQNLPMHDEP